MKQFQTRDDTDMSEERHEKLSIEEIKERLRTGYVFYPTQPGLQQAARELIRPLVEPMKGREIVYVCRVPRLLRVEELKVDDDGFQAVGVHVHDLGCKSMEELYREFVDARAGERVEPSVQPKNPPPLDFGASWQHLRLSGSAICMNMLTDHFFTDPDLVAEVKAAAARHAAQGEILAILNRPEGKP